MAISGSEGLSNEEVQSQLEQGARFVIFSYTISLLVVTFKRNSPIYFIRAGEGTFAKSLPYTLLSLAFGWWGIPWGFIYTPMSLATNLGGGKDVTAQLLAAQGG